MPTVAPLEETAKPRVKTKWGDKMLKRKIASGNTQDTVRLDGGTGEGRIFWCDRIKRIALHMEELVYIGATKRVIVLLATKAGIVPRRLSSLLKMGPLGISIIRHLAVGFSSYKRGHIYLHFSNTPITTSEEESVAVEAFYIKMTIVEVVAIRKAKKREEAKKRAFEKEQAQPLSRTERRRLREASKKQAKATDGLYLIQGGKEDTDSPRLTPEEVNHKHNRKKRGKHLPHRMSRNSRNGSHRSHSSGRR